MKKKIQILVFFLGVLVVWEIIRLYPHFKKYQQIASTLPNLKPIESNPTARSFPFPKKIWIHRVNSTERASYLESKYEGIEMDITFDTLTKTFDVGHPPSPSIGLSLENFFSKISHLHAHCFWLDFKNLREDNKKSACEKLLSLSKAMGIEHRIIVESQNAEALNIFTEAGFYTSYYVPVFHLETSSKGDIEKKYAEIQSALIHAKVCAVSGEASQYVFLEKYLPQYEKLLWQLDEKHGFSYYVTSFYLRLKSKVKVILVNENSPGYR